MYLRRSELYIIIYYYDVKVGHLRHRHATQWQIGRVWPRRQRTPRRPPRHAPACTRSAPAAEGTGQPSPSCSRALPPSHSPRRVEIALQDDMPASQPRAHVQRAADAAPRALLLLGVDIGVE